jgi:soluble lytic murein transglycosylase-like protein
MIRPIALALCASALVLPASAQDSRSQFNAMVEKHAAANGVPAALVHRVIVRESRYNPRAIGRGGAMGMMQIKHATARGMGYTGSSAGLLDAETNLTYAVKYLAGAYKVAGGNHDRAVAYYASGYYYAAKRQGLTERTPRSERGSRRFARMARLEETPRSEQTPRYERTPRSERRRYYSRRAYSRSASWRSSRWSRASMSVAPRRSEISH